MPRSTRPGPKRGRRSSRRVKTRPTRPARAKGRGLPTEAPIRPGDDRSELILDIFATRARSSEARLAVELAQLEYALPRLKQMWTHLSRQTVGGIGLRGPGETQLEVDRRTRTAVPYAQTSVHVLPSSDVSNRNAMIASAPFDCASSITRSVACWRATFLLR